jgi:hypothetical protein
LALALSLSLYRDLQEIQAETGARVQVSNETLPQSSEKTVRMHFA